MPSTSEFGIPYPALGDSPHGPNQLEALAEWLEDNAFPQLLRKLFATFAGYHEVLTLQTTTSAAYVDLGTVGPTVTLTSTGTKALVLMACQQFVSNESQYGSAMSVAVSGDTTIAASDAFRLAATEGPIGEGLVACQFAWLTINPGSNTYTSKYRVGNASITGNFSQRRLLVVAP